MSNRGFREALARGVARWPRTSATAALLADCAMKPFTPHPSGTEQSTQASGLPALSLTASRAPWRRSVRYKVLSSALWYPDAPPPSARMVSMPDPGTLQAPLVLVSFHLGPMLALGLLLDRLTGDVLAFTAGFPSRPTVKTANVEGDEWQRVAAFRIAVDTLQSGGFVFIAADGARRKRVHTTIFGRTVPMARGPFALSRLTGAPMLPVVARWRRGRIEIVAGDPIPLTDEATMAAALGTWLERHLREDPEDLGPEFVDYLRRSPLADDALDQRTSESLVADLSVLGTGNRPPRDDADAAWSKAQRGDDLA